MDLVFSANCGLCNRLRAIVTFKNLYTGPFFIYWKQDEACNGYFSEVFNAIEGHPILENIHPKDLDNMNLIDNGCNPFLDYPDLGYDVFKMFEPNDSVLKAIEDLKLPDKYDAIHLRGTDRSGWAEIKNEELVGLVDNSEHPIFIATDDIKKYEECVNLFGDRIIKSGFKPLDGLRQTTLKRAVVDLFVCVNSENFSGSTGSSFSGQIEFMKTYKENYEKYKI
jgi:hypothetical protein